MSSIDNRIVSMKFDNAQFERGVSTTISSMDKLKQSLNFKDAQKPLQNLGSSIANFKMGNMEGAITGVSTAFMAMSTIGITALSNITNKAIAAGTQMVKSLTIDPIAAGFSEYELKMGSIQTILANTARYGTKLEDVTKSLEELNIYADKTIYNFGDMTKNIGLFTNAGIRLEDATSMIKGFSNAAAASGTSAEGAAGAAYQLSQALSSGKVTLMDWKSLTNVGMGNKNMQEGIINIAKAMGTFRGKGIGAKDAQKNFNATLEKGWLTADVMSNYLQIMAGDMDKAKMKALGLSDAQIKTFQEQQKTAEEAATKVRTFTQLIGTMREAVGSGWSQTFEIIFGNFDEATELFTGISNALGGWINASAEARNKILEDWKTLGGRTHLINGFKNIFEALGRVLGPIRDAFRDIFPPITGKRLNELSISFEKFTERLSVNDAAMENLKSTFKGIFAVFSILKQLSHGVIKVVLSVFDALAGPAGGAGGGFLAITAKIGDFISGIDAMLKRTKVIENFFGAIGGAIAAVITIIADLGKAIVGLFTGGDISFFDNLSGSFANLGPIMEGIQTKIQGIVDVFKGIFGKFQVPEDMFGLTKATDATNASLTQLNDTVEETGSMFDGLGEKAKAIASGIGEAFSWVWDALGNVMAGVSLEEVLGTINTAFFVMLYRQISKFMGSMTGLLESYGKMFEGAGNVLNGFTGALKGMQMNLRADALLKLAIAILVLVAALWLLSLMDPMDIAIGLGAFAAMLFILSKSLNTFGKALSVKQAGQMAAMSASLILLAIAMTMMAAAVLAFGSMEPDTLKKGFAGVVATLAIMVIALAAFNAAGGPKKLAGVAGSLMLMSIALDMLLATVLLFSKIDTDTMLQGLWKIAALMGILAIFLKLVSGAKVGSLIGLVAAAIALNILADAMEQIGKIPSDEAKKALFTIAIALTILAIALILMESTLPGAAALLVAVVALKLLVPVLRELGEMEWGTIGKGLLALAGAFVVIALGGLLLYPVIPVLLLFGAAVALLGVGLFLAGTGILLFSTALVALVAIGAAGFAVLAGAVITFVELLPLIAEQFGLALVAFAEVIGEKAPELVRAFGKLFRAFIDEVARQTPYLVAKVFDMMMALVVEIIKHMPEWADAATKLLETFAATFGSEENITRLTTAAADIVINFLNGLAQTIRDKDDELIDAGKNIGSAIVGGIGKGLMNLTPLGGAISWLVDRIKGEAEEELDANSPSKLFIPIGGTIPEGMAVGIEKYSGMAVAATKDMGDATVIQMKDTISRISEVMDTDLDSEPVISPVLDLTDFRRTAAGLNDALQTNPLTVGVTYEQAAGIASTKQPIEETLQPQQAQQPAINFEQNNYSPKALTPAEIYRNTRNQLTFARELMVG